MSNALYFAVRIEELNTLKPSKDTAKFLVLYILLKTLNILGLVLNFHINSLCPNPLKHRLK